MNNNAIITNGTSTRKLFIYLSSLSNSVQKFVTLLQLNIKSLNAALDSGTNFNEYVTTNALDERSKQLAEKHGLLFLVYVHLEAAPNLCKREEHLLSARLCNTGKARRHKGKVRDIPIVSVGVEAARIISTKDSRAAKKILFNALRTPFCPPLFDKMRRS